MKFPAPAVRFVRPTARAPARPLIQKKLLCQVTQESPSASPLPSTPPAELLPRSSGAGSHHAMRPDLRASSGFRNFPLADPARCELTCRFTQKVQRQASSASWFMQFMQCAMYADKPSSSLETEQFRFRFEMAVDRTHSRAFICRRRRRRTPRPTQFRGSDQEGARAQMAPSERSKIVKNTSFMQSIHADRTRISENRRASSEGVLSFETPFKGRMDALFPRLASFESCGQGCCINT